MKNIVVSLLLLVVTASTYNQPNQTETTVESFNKSATTTSSNIQRIKIATVSTQDLQATKHLYQQWLNYKLVEEDLISEALANSWGAPATAGKPYALMQSASGDDVYLRAIEVTMPESYKAMTSYGWNAIEIIVEDPDAIHQKLLDSPFIHIGGPANLGDVESSIRAVQFIGPSEEVFYFTTDTGDRSTSTLLTPRAPIDRPFIMVVAGPNAQTMTDFYVPTLGAKPAFFVYTKIEVIARAQGLSEDHLFPLSFVRLGEFSNSIEIDGYSNNAGPRMRAAGELPPGVSIATFSVKDLNAINPDLFITAPQKHNGLGYAGKRSATIIGPAGELIELIEEN